MALRAGARVATLPLSPAMAFIDTSETIVGVEIAQIFVRYVEPGQPVELTFKFAPGKILTGKGGRAVEPRWLDYSHARPPLPRLGRSEDVAHAALFLASDEASFITGENLMVDGGWMAS